eukprot:362589-Chlamydomonas_euryale.AAC.2
MVHDSREAGWVDEQCSGRASGRWRVACLPAWGAPLHTRGASYHCIHTRGHWTLGRPPVAPCQSRNVWDACRLLVVTALHFPVAVHAAADGGCYNVPHNAPAPLETTADKWSRGSKGGGTERMERACRVHGLCRQWMYNAWIAHGRYMENVWTLHGHGVDNACRARGHCMDSALPRRAHKQGMAWQLHGSIVHCKASKRPKRQVQVMSVGECGSADKVWRCERACHVGLHPENRVRIATAEGVPPETRVVRKASNMLVYKNNSQHACMKSCRYWSSVHLTPETWRMLL